MKQYSSVPEFYFGMLVVNGIKYEHLETRHCFLQNVEQIAVERKNKNLTCKNQWHKKYFSTGCHSRNLEDNSRKL